MKKIILLLILVSQVSLSQYVPMNYQYKTTDSTQRMFPSWVKTYDDTAKVKFAQYLDSLTNKYTKADAQSTIRDSVIKYFCLADTSGSKGFYVRGMIDALLLHKFDKADTNLYYKAAMITALLAYKYNSSDTATYYYQKGMVDALLNLKQNSIPNLADTLKYLEPLDTANANYGWYKRGYIDALLNAKQNSIANLADTSKYLEPMDSTSATLGWYKRAYIDALIAGVVVGTFPNAADTAKYIEESDSASATKGWYKRGCIDALLNYKQATISNLADTSK
jgi:hypothetical protein